MTHVACDAKMCGKNIEIAACHMHVVYDDLELDSAQWTLL